MLEGLMGAYGLAASDALLGGAIATAWSYVLIVIGFSVVVFVHELGHFLAAKWCDVRVERFAVGFGRALFSYRKGIGFRRRSSEAEYQERLVAHVEEKRKEEVRLKEKTGATDSELAEAARELNLGETEYRFNWLPLGGYVKMLGQEDFEVDKSGELAVKGDPRSFPHKSVGRRMLIVSAGVVMNTIFAALVFMAVFMMGVESLPAVIGTILGESPAARAGLEPGDRIVQINDDRVMDFQDLQMSVMLADPAEALSIVYRRTDPTTGAVTTGSVKIQPSYNEDRSVLELGVSPRLDNVVGAVLTDPLLPFEQQLMPGDRILEIDGRRVSDFLEILVGLARHKSEFASLKVERTLADGRQQVREVKRRCPRVLYPTLAGQPGRSNGHILGLVPRIEIANVEEGSRGDLAGMRPGDVIRSWDGQLAPLPSEVSDSVGRNYERDIRVELARYVPGELQPKTIAVVVRPGTKGLLGRGRPRVGLAIDEQEEDLPVVADIVTLVRDDIATPAAKLKGVMPRGALITKVNGAEVKAWGEVIDQFIRLAGTDVAITWQSPDDSSQSASIYVPRTLGTVFDLPGGDIITRIDGKTSIEVSKDGRSAVYSVSNWLGASKLLEECVGRTVEVQHRSPLDREAKSAQIEVTREMLDTWVMRIDYFRSYPDMTTLPVLEKMRVRNPITAMAIGVRKTYFFIESVYVMIQRMLITRSVGFDQVAGPIGIVKAGSDIARQDFAKLLYFLALISANLAVINFLPLPIFDGGLMVFLLIEKLKGGPIPVKVQIVTQLVGLALIITIFVYVTIQDVQRFFG